MECSCFGFLGLSYLDFLSLWYLSFRSFDIRSLCCFSFSFLGFGFRWTSCWQFSDKHGIFKFARFVSDVSHIFPSSSWMITFLFMFRSVWSLFCSATLHDSFSFSFSFCTSPICRWGCIHISHDRYEIRNWRFVVNKSFQCCILCNIVLWLLFEPGWLLNHFVFLLVVDCDGACVILYL